MRLPVDPSFEHGVLVDVGDLTLAGQLIEPTCLGYVEQDAEQIVLKSGATPVRAVLMGGTPFGEQILMWWNFVGRSNEEVAQARAQWQAAIAGDPDGVIRFGQVKGYDGVPRVPLPAPQLPTVRLKPRRR